MIVLMLFRVVGPFAGVRVGVKVDLAVVVMMDVEMDALRKQTPEYVNAQANEHDADHQLKKVGEAFRHDRVKNQNDGAKQK
jgi:hypothetical protein